MAVAAHLTVRNRPWNSESSLTCDQDWPGLRDKRRRREADDMGSACSVGAREAVGTKPPVSATAFHHTTSSVPDEIRKVGVGAARAITRNKAGVSSGTPNASPPASAASSQDYSRYLLAEAELAGMPGLC